MHVSAVVLPEAVPTGDLRPSCWVSGLVEALRARGHAVALFGRPPREPRALLPSARPAPEGADPETDGPPSEADLLPRAGALGRALGERWGRERPDVALAVGPLSGLVAMAASRDTGVPVVHMVPAPTGGSAPPAELLRLESAVARSATAVVATNSDAVAALVRHGVPRRAITTVPCGVDVRAFPPDGARLLEPSDARLLVVSGPEPGDAVRTALEALPLVPGAELVVAGLSPAGAAEVEQRAARAGVAGRVRALRRLPWAEMAALYRSCTALLALSRSDGLGRAALEAMSCGLPVVALNAGAPGDLVVAGATGVLLPPSVQAQQLAATLRRLLTDSVSLGAFSISGVDRARSRYSWERVAGDVESVLSRAAGIPVGMGRAAADETS